MNPVIDAIVAAVAAGAAVGLKENATQAVRDAYGAVRAALTRGYPQADLSGLEADPSSRETRASLAKHLSDAGAADDLELLRSSIALARVIRSDAAPEAVADVTLKDLEGQYLVIDGIRGHSARVTVEKVRTQGGITISNVDAGGTADPKA